MQANSFLFQAFVYLGVAVISVPIAKRFGFGSVLGYLFAGMIIGPYGFELIGQEGQDVMHFAEFGVVMMLFLIGLELQPSLLWRMRKSIVGLGGLQVVLTAAVITIICQFIGIIFKTSLAIGLILSLSSTAIVLQTLNEKGLIKTDAGQKSFSVLLFQDIAVIPLLAVMPLLAVKAVENTRDAAIPHYGAGWVENLPGWGQAVAVAVVIIAIIAGGNFLVRPFFRIIAKTQLRELFTAGSLLLIIGIALLMSSVGLSPALGTFLAGVVLANCEYRHELEGSIEPFKGLLLGLFFIAVGSAIDFDLILSSPVHMAMIVIGLICVKLVVLFFLGRISKMGIDQNILFMFALAQSGEFAFVLFSFAVQNNVISENLANPLIGAVAISMALTPLLLLINEKFFQPRFGTKEKEEKEADSIDEKHPVIIAGFGNFGSIIGRLLRANGVGMTVLDIDSDNVDLLRKLGLNVFYGNASRVDLLISAGAESAKVLILAMKDHETVLDIFHIAKKHFPRLIVFARAAGRTQAYELLDAGVHYVYRDTLDTSLRAGIDILRNLGFRSHQAHRATKTFREHDEESIEELRHLRHDRNIYISKARERIEDLERLLLSELLDSGEHYDAGWDTASMREGVKAEDKGKEK